MPSRYQLVRKVADGGMAEVFLARMVGVDGFEKEVAVKRLREELARDPDSLDLFRREAMVAGQLHHPHIVQVLDFSIEGLFLVLEYVDGSDLDGLQEKLVLERRKLTPSAIAYIGARICDALGFLYRLRDDRGGRVVEAHRDISASNVLISRAGAIKLSDFGVVRLRHARTAVGKVRGKWEYFPPEIIQGTHDERGDVWALGVTLYKLAALQHPFAAPTPPGHLERACREAPARITRLPDRLWGVLEKALARDPAKRYQKADELGLALEEFLCTSREPMGPRILADQLFGLGNAEDDPESGRITLREMPAVVIAPALPPVPAPKVDTQPAGPEIEVDVDMSDSHSGSDEVAEFEAMFGPAKKKPETTPKPLVTGEVGAEELYARFSAMRAAAGQPGPPLSMRAFQRTLEAQRRALETKNPGKQVEFDIEVRDGAPQLRPRMSPKKK